MQCSETPVRTTCVAHVFVAAFADAVTVQSSHRYDWVARRGKHSMYDLIIDLAPLVRLIKKRNFNVWNLKKYLEQGLQLSGGSR